MLSFWLTCLALLALTPLISGLTSHVNLPTSCIGLTDGTYMMKLIDGNYPIVQVKCSNEYMVIDYSNDASWSEYFTSWYKYHYAVAAPSRNDHANWERWFIPNVQYTSNGGSDKFQYVLSPNCDVCDANDEYHQRYGDQSTYYLSALAFGCFNPTRGWPACDMDFFTYGCKICEWNTDMSQIFSYPRGTMTTADVATSGKLAGVCDFEIQSSSSAIATTFTECQRWSTNSYKPSIGLNAQNCVCSKPAEKTTVTVTDKEFQAALSRSLEPAAVTGSPVEKTSTNNALFLFQTDFEHGTYRITEPGTYRIMEDIIFDFNAGDDKDPLSDDAWWPRAAQSDVYDGAREARGSYFLGFFAGITIECDDVVLDLNGHTLAMSTRFFYTQAFFALIELASQPFLPQQGPGFFGSDPTFATNVVVKNGVLGLTSHHAIHGNFNKHVQFLNLRVKDFQTHGIQLNGFEHVLVQDVEIGPTTDRVTLNGHYAQMRQILPTLRKLAAATAGQTVTFAGRSKGVSMRDLLEELEPLMLKAFDYAVSGTDYSDDKDWPMVSKLFINPTGQPFGAVVYGLFLNYPSAGIFGWHVNDDLSYDATIKNVKIHGLRHSGLEILGLAENNRVYCNAFNGPLSLNAMLSPEVATAWSDNLIVGESSTAFKKKYQYAQYKGDIVSDVWLAMYYFGSSDYDYWAGIPYMGETEEMIAWMQDAESTHLSSTNTGFRPYCNEDNMFHPAKGLLGLKMSGTNQVRIENVEIFDLVDSTPLGKTECGSRNLYHFSQQKPYQIGFSMNMVHGITVDYIDDMRMTDVSVHHLQSRTGLVYGIATWFQTDITMSGSISVNNLAAGVASSAVNDLAYSDRPNKAPEACAIKKYSNTDYKVTIAFDGITEDDIDVSCITGYVGCSGKNVFSRIGTVSNENCKDEYAPAEKVDDVKVNQENNVVVDTDTDTDSDTNTVDRVSGLTDADLETLLADGGLRMAELSELKKRELVLDIHESRESLLRTLDAELAAWRLKKSVDAEVEVEVDVKMAPKVAHKQGVALNVLVYIFVFVFMMGALVCGRRMYYGQRKIYQKYKPVRTVAVDMDEYGTF